MLSTDFFTNENCTYLSVILNVASPLGSVLADTGGGALTGVGGTWGPLRSWSILAKRGSICRSNVRKSTSCPVIKNINKDETNMSKLGTNLLNSILYNICFYLNIYSYQQRLVLEDL